VRGIYSVGLELELAASTADLSNSTRESELGRYEWYLQGREKMERILRHCTLLSFLTPWKILGRAVPGLQLERVENFVTGRVKPRPLMGVAGKNNHKLNTIGYRIPG